MKPLLRRNKLLAKTFTINDQIRKGINLKLFTIKRRDDKMVRRIKRALVLLTGLTAVSLAQSPAQSPVGINGKLSVEGLHLVNQYHQPIQLRGVSGHGAQWLMQCYTDNAVKALAESWKGDVFRIVLYIHEGGYLDSQNKDYWINYIDRMVTACEKYGLYAIIDWHVTKPGDPNIDINAAKDFWQTISQKYGGKKHVLYDIVNEPSEANQNDDWLNKTITTWEKVKAYADIIIPIIRNNDPSNVILVGTPSWSTLDISRFSEIPSDAKWQKIRDNPLTYTNFMYVFHFYGDHHKYIYQFLTKAADELPVFCSEWNDAGPFQYSNHNKAEGQKWVDWMYAKKISWCYFAFAQGNAYPQNTFNDGACDQNMGVNGALTEAGKNLKDYINTPPKFFPVKDSLYIVTWAPTGTISLPTTTLRVETLVNATVRYSTSNVPYSQMTDEMSGSGTKVHTVALSNLKDRDTCKYYVCAANGSDTLKTNQLISFVVMLPHPECIDGFENTTVTSNSMGPWSVSGAISPLESKTPGYNSAKCAHVTLNGGNAQIILKAKDANRKADLSQVTSISFAYKSSSECTFRVECNPMDPNSPYHWIKLPASTDWKWDTLTWPEYQNPVGANRDWPLDLSLIKQITWNFSGSTSGEFWLDSLTFNGIFPDFKYVPPVVDCQRLIRATVQGHSKAYQIADALFLQYALSTPCMMTATLFDIQGKYITTIAKTQRQQGNFSERIKLPAMATEGLYVVKFNPESGLSPVRIITMKR
jgi:aryl-phospho-beta-D-glucosidase BglC (GH1 family)